MQRQVTEAVAQHAYLPTAPRPLQQGNRTNVIQHRGLLTSVKHGASRLNSAAGAVFSQVRWNGGHRVMPACEVRRLERELNPGAPQGISIAGLLKCLAYLPQ